MTVDCSLYINLQVRQLLRKGVPMEMRSRVWQLFLNSNALRGQSSFKYKVNTLC